MSSRGQKQTKWWLDHEMKKNMEIYVHELQVYREKFGLKTYPYLDKNGDVYQLEFNEWMNIIEKSKLNKFLEFLVMNSNSETMLKKIEKAKRKAAASEPFQPYYDGSKKIDRTNIQEFIDTKDRQMKIVALYKLDTFIFGKFGQNPKVRWFLLTQCK